MKMVYKTYTRVMIYGQRYVSKIARCDEYVLKLYQNYDAETMCTRSQMVDSVSTHPKPNET